MTRMSTDLREGVGVFWRDVKYAVRSLAGAKGLTITVVLTLALGIGANAAIFTLVRGVLLRPLVNRDEDRLIYIRQSARGMGMDNAVFSVPELQDLRQRVKSLSAFGDFSDHRFHPERAGRAARGAGGRCRRQLLRRDGPASGAGAAARYAGRRPGRRRGRGSDVSLLDHRAEERPVGARKSRQAGIVRIAHGDGRRGIGTIDPVSGRNRDHRQYCDQSTPPVGDDGDGPGPSHDRAVWPAGPGRNAGTGSRRAQGGTRRHDERASRGVSREGGLPHRRGAVCATRLRPKPGPCFGCCWPRRDWSSSSPVPMWPT